MNQPRDTRSDLVAAARPLFAERGYAGASVRAITKAASVNLGAVSYHFGSKEGLYHAVLASVWEPLLERLPRMLAGDLPALLKIEAVLQSLFAVMGAQPCTAPLMLRELSRSTPVPAPLRASIELLLTALGDLIRAGQADGSIVAGDPRLLALSVVAQPFHLMAVRQKLAQVIGLAAGEEQVFAAMVANAQAFVRRGLAARWAATDR